MQIRRHTNTRASGLNLEPLDEASSVPTEPTFTLYNGPDEIVFTPEDALKQGLAMVEQAKRSIATLHIANKLRRDVWDRELQSLQRTGAQKTMIALCGATGSGKSSVINALLDDNIVPTSGMAACTATVTEIAYHDLDTIEAEIQFLTKEEWLSDVKALLGDMNDDGGQLKRINDPRGESGIAWSKVHAVYPGIKQKEIILMSPEKIVESDPRVTRILDTTKRISCAGSSDLQRKIKKYIESKNQEKDKGRDKDGMGPAYWPLIKQVRVWVKAEALSTGAVLCDLPGTADTNAARSNIAKQYMKNANCIWIFAPIQRAVNDQIARELLGHAFRAQLMMDGHYDGSTVTFIATKADDVAASEIIDALGLEDPELVDLLENKEKIRMELRKGKQLKAKLSSEVKILMDELRRCKIIQDALGRHLDSLRSGTGFVEVLDAKIRRSVGYLSSGATKHRDSSPEGGDSDGNYFTASPNSEEEEGEGGEEEDERGPRSNIKHPHPNSSLSGTSTSSVGSNVTDNLGSYRGRSKKSKLIRSNGNEDHYSALEDADGDHVETEVSLKAKISAEDTQIYGLRSRISALETEQSVTSSNLVNAERQYKSVQMEVDAFCALKRSEFSRQVLSEDFRAGLRELDESAAQDTESFDPSVDLRDYGAINLKVFCVSARDYARIHKLNQVDGGPSVFVDERHTEIPALRDWCKELTINSRMHTFNLFYESLSTFVKSALSHIEGVEKSTYQVERGALCSQWQTPPSCAFVPEKRKGWIEDKEDMSYLSRDEDSKGDVGIYSRLCKDFEILEDKFVQDLKRKMRRRLQGACDEGATLAEESALGISDQFAREKAWNTYRASKLQYRSPPLPHQMAQSQLTAAIIRHGEFLPHNLNELLCTPLTKTIASSWAQVFESNLLGFIESRVLSCIKDLLTQIENSIKSPGLKEKCQSQRDLALEEAKAALRKAVAVMTESLQSQQKEISRRISPMVRDGLYKGYCEAGPPSGPGSSAVRKSIFRRNLDDVRMNIFKGTMSQLLSQLDVASDKVKELLSSALKELAQKVEVSLSTLWEDREDTPEQLVAHSETRRALLEISHQIKFWQQAQGLVPSLNGLTT